MKEFIQKVYKNRKDEVWSKIKKEKWNKANVKEFKNKKNRKKFQK